jgi:hypothetical protein
MGADNLAADLLRGAKAIAKHVYGKTDGHTQRRVYHKHQTGDWPIWKDGSDLISRKSLLDAHFQPTTKSSVADAA